jgi:hypothetical protein
MTRRTLSIVMLAGLLASGCETRLQALSTPPPGKVAALDEVDEQIELSHGAALAVACEFQNSPCENVTITSDDPAIADARLGYFDDLEDGMRSSKPVSAFVVIGRSPGITVLHVRGSDADADYRVSVLED